MRQCVRSIPTVKLSTLNPHSALKQVLLTWLEHYLNHKLLKMFISTKTYIIITKVTRFRPKRQATGETIMKYPISW